MSPKDDSRPSDLVVKIFDSDVQEGVFFNEDDIKSYAHVAIIGSKVKEKLFGSNNSLGEKIKIKDRNFKVIGVLAKKGQASFFNFDEMAIIPYTTAQQYVLGIKHFHRFVVEAASEKEIEQTARDIELTLRNSHGISHPDDDDFYVETQADLVSRVSMITDVFTLFLIAVAAISLLVGGIGIMNIMLVSVTERTREIGLRKSLGATETDILKQFLLEAVILTFLGGLLGTALGLGLSLMASFVISKTVSANWAFVFPLSAVFLGLSVATLIGLIFGLYPARRAAALNPIDAIRYE